MKKSPFQESPLSKSSIARITHNRIKSLAVEFDGEHIGYIEKAAREILIQEGERYAKASLPKKLFSSDTTDLESTVIDFLDQYERYAKDRTLGERIRDFLGIKNPKIEKIFTYTLDLIIHQIDTSSQPPVPMLPYNNNKPPSAVEKILEERAPEKGGELIQLADYQRNGRSR